MKKQKAEFDRAYRGQPKEVKQQCRTEQEADFAKKVCEPSVLCQDLKNFTKCYLQNLCLKKNYFCSYVNFLHGIKIQSLDLFHFFDI